MPRLSIVLVSFGLALGASAACGGGGGGDDDGDGSDGGGPDGSVGPGEPAEGLFEVIEGHFGEDAFLWGNAYGTIEDPRPRYHRLEGSEGACRLWTYEVGSCGTCDGLCNADGDCVPYPAQLSAGAVTVEGLSQGVVLEEQPYGYYPAAALANELFAAGDEVTLSAAGGGDVPAFSLAARGVDAIDMALRPGFDGGDVDSLTIEDGDDLVLVWSPVVPGTRVRLEILSNNAGHGLPVDAMIECESDDAGRLVVPRAFVEAFPQKPYQNACAGSDCPPSALTRFRSDRAEVGGRAIELRVEARRQFIVIHNPA
jgi:hypothetical protein